MKPSQRGGRYCTSRVHGSQQGWSGRGEEKWEISVGGTGEVLVGGGLQENGIEGGCGIAGREGGFVEKMESCRWRKQLMMGRLEDLRS